MRPSSSADGAHRSSTASPGPAQAPGPPQLRLHRAEPPAPPAAPAPGSGLRDRARPRAVRGRPRGLCAAPIQLPRPRGRCSRQVGVLDDELDVLVRQLGDAHRGLVGVRHGRPAPSLPSPPRPARPPPPRPPPAGRRRLPEARTRPPPVEAGGDAARCGCARLYC